MALLAGTNSFSKIVVIDGPLKAYISSFYDDGTGGTTTYDTGAIKNVLGILYYSSGGTVIAPFSIDADNTSATYGTVRYDATSINPTFFTFMIIGF